jgi:hypothetical protein
VHQLWVERAAKIIRQATHIGNLIEHFEFMGDIAFRLTDETLPSLKKSMNENNIYNGKPPETMQVSKE